jgi:predicted phage terminase large subunit-like protein
MRRSTPCLPSPRERFREELKAEKGRRSRQHGIGDKGKRSLRAFIEAAWPLIEPAKPFIPNWHIDAICEHLEALRAGQIRNLLINIPPGHAKSMIVSVAFPAWIWATDGQFRSIFASYHEGLAYRDSVKCRALLDDPWYRDTFQPTWDLSRDQNQKSYYENTEKGFRLSLTVNGGTGYRGHLVAVDDPINVKDQYSDAALEGCIFWWDQVMSSRFINMATALKLIIMQRVSEKDLSGHVLAQGGYEHLMLPSEYESKRKCVTSIGWVDPRETERELLFPALFTPEVIADRKRILGSVGYAGQELQRPAPAEGGLYKRDWWQMYKLAELPALDSMCISVDATFKDSKDSDYVAIQCWGFLGPRCYLIDRIHAQMGFSATKQAVKTMIAKHKRAYAVLIEDKANGSAIIEELGREFSGIIAVNPEGGKLARAWSTSPDVEAHNVYLPEDLPGIGEFIEEHASFPNAAHDDDVDCQTQALNWRKAGAMRMGLAGYLKSEQEREMQSAGLLAKPVIAEQTLRCEKCESISIATINGMHRCGNCGNQWSKDKAKDESRYRDTRGSLMLK